MVAIEPLGRDAAAEGLALTVEAGWNQTVDDWVFFLRHGTVFGARGAGGQLVATAALLPYPADFAWVGLVIVAQAQRGRGLGTRMLKHCIATLRTFGLVGVLDATPAGEKVYTPLGFKAVFGLERWQGAGGGAPQHGGRVRPLEADRMERMGALDAQAFGAKRDTLLADYCARTGTRGFELTGGHGYALVRRGRVASQVGPVVAPDPHDALALIDAAVASTPGPILIDVPDEWIGVAAWLRSRSFTVQRPFLRMALGRGVGYGDPARVFAIAGPEYGEEVPVGLHRTDLPRRCSILARGTVIPAHPLALDAARRFDRRRQRALTRYYIDAGAGGLAVGVHTTQFAIREAGCTRRCSRLRSKTAELDRAPAGPDCGRLRTHAPGGKRGAYGRAARLPRRARGPCRLKGDTEARSSPIVGKSPKRFRWSASTSRRAWAASGSTRSSGAASRNSTTCSRSR
jgi:GNAT superfamily N-acetyltransferase